MYDAAQRLTYDHARAMLDAGASPRALIGGNAGMAPVRWLEPENFEPDDAGEPALILPLRRYGTLLDLLAWDWTAGRHGRLTGRVWALGADNAGPNRMTEALEIVDTVPAYLARPFDSLMVLDERRAWEELRHVGRLETRNRQLARRVERMMQAPPWKGRVAVARRDRSPSQRESAQPEPAAGAGTSRHTAPQARQAAGISPDKSAVPAGAGSGPANGSPTPA